MREDAHLHQLIQQARRLRSLALPGRVDGARWVPDHGPHLQEVGPAATDPQARLLGRLRGPGTWVCLTPPPKNQLEQAMKQGLRALWVGWEHPRLDPPTRAWLQDAGVQLNLDRRPGPVFALHRGPDFRAAHGRPLMTLKVAASLDGRIATASGNSRWVTQGWARRRARALRFDHDAVLVGSGTALQDDPLLLSRMPGPEPLRVVLDGRGRLPVSSRLVQSAQAGPLAVVSERPRPELEERGVQVWVVRRGVGSAHLDWTSVLAHLQAAGVASVWVEGGGQVLGSLRDAGLIDRVEWFVAATVVGGQGALPAVGGVGSRCMADALRIQRLQLRRIGPDLWLRGWASGRCPLQAPEGA